MIASESSLLEQENRPCLYLIGGPMFTSATGQLFAKSRRYGASLYGVAVFTSVTFLPTN